VHVQNRRQLEPLAQRWANSSQLEVKYAVDNPHSSRLLIRPYVSREIVWIISAKKVSSESTVEI